MKRLILVAAAFIILSASIALAQVGMPWPGPGTPASTPASFVSKSNTADGAAFSGTTTSATITTTAGDFIVGFVVANPTTLTISSVKIGATNCSVGTISNTGTAYNGAPFVCWNLAGGTTTVTATLSTTCGGCNIYIEEWSGALTSGTPIDGNHASTNFGPSGGASICAGAFTPSANGDMIWAGAFSANGTTGYTAGSGFTLLPGLPNDGNNAEWLVQSSATSVNGCFTVTAGSLENVIVAIGIKHP